MMAMNYRVGMPGWRLLAKLGASLYFRVKVSRDDEAGVYWAESPDLRGLVIEAATLEELLREVNLGAAELLEPHRDDGAINADPVVRFDHAHA